MKKERLFYIENLRVFLILLVIMQHIVRSYGTVVWWYVKDDRAPLLEHFTAVNSSFFMSLFFLISFYFLPESYDKKGVKSFHLSRFYRLAVPLIFYTFIIVPCLAYFYYCNFRNYESINFFKYYYSFFLGLSPKPSDWSGPGWPDINCGHLWFVEHLIIYGIIYSLFRLINKSDRFTTSGIKFNSKFPSSYLILIYTLLLSIVTFLIRLKYPLYNWIGFLGFIQIEFAHFPYYITMFFGGIYAYRNSWFTKLPVKTGMIWLTIGIISACITAIQPVDNIFFGGWSLQALQYSIFETFSCIGLVIGLIYFFRDYCNRQNRLLKIMAQNSYMVYIIHIVIIVLFQFLLLPVKYSPYLKFLFLSVISVPLIFLLSICLRKIPYAKKYL